MILIKIFIGNLRKILIKLIFNRKTISFIESYFAKEFGKYSLGLSNVNINILKQFTNICLNIANKFDKFLDEEDYFCPFDERVDEEENIKFEKINELFKVRFLGGSPFFHI